MRIYIDLVSLLPTAELWQRAEIITTATAKRGDGGVLELQFHRDGQPERLPEGTVITFCVKSQGQFDQNPALVEIELTDDHRPGAEDGFYIAEPDYNTDPLNEALRSGDDDDENDLRFVNGDGEVSWLLPTLGAKPKSSQTFNVRLENDVKKGNEGPPGAGEPGYLTEAQSDARYLGEAHIFTATVDEDAGTVDITIPDAAAVLAPLGVLKPSPGADNIFIVSLSRPDATTARAHLSADAPEAGYQVTIFAR